jgi:hypothetical protein
VYGTPLPTGGEIVKAIMKAATTGQDGNVLVIVLVLLAVGSLILAPLLGLMGTGVLAGQVYEDKTEELYAADAGVEDAIWRIETDLFDSYPYEYAEPLVINDKSVNITVFRRDLDPTCREELRYRIISTATSEDGSGTTVDTHLSVSYLDLSAFLDNAIVSNSTITIQPGNVVNGDVWLPDRDDLTNKGSIDGTVKDTNNMTVTWPTYEQFSSWYLALAGGDGATDPGPCIDVKYDQTIGPCYREGSLEVDNTGDEATLVLEGIAYIAGDLEFQQAGSKNYTINLNGHTIFVEGGITFASDHVGISGSGCIIAAGDIDFQPSIDSEGDEFVLVMSILGEVEFHPSGTFTGCIVGNVNVQLQPGNTIDWISPEGKGLDFPLGVGDADELPPVTGTTIESWEIS